MDAIQLLESQHREVEDLFEEIEGSDDNEDKMELFEELADKLAVHASIEEHHFYPAVKDRRTKDILLESLEEHLSLKRLLADLIELPLSAPTFAAKFQVLKEQTEHHHKEEEEHLFPKVMLLLDADARADLGRKMEALQQRLQRAGAPRAAVADQTEAAAPLQPTDAGQPGR